jgi:hypothetical protein
MPQYVRAFVPDGTFFFTVTLRDAAGTGKARSCCESRGLAVFKLSPNTCNAVFMPLNGRQMLMFGVWRWNDTKGGMRFAFPPYGPPFYLP